MLIKLLQTCLSYLLACVRIYLFHLNNNTDMHRALLEKYSLLFGIIILSLISISTTNAASTTIIPTSESSFVPDTNFFNENGDKVYLDQYEGKTILLVFWATWCGACISEMPSLDTLQKDFKQLPFEVIAVSEDFTGTGVVKDHFQSQEIRHLAIYHDYQNQLFRAMSVVGLPTAFLIDQTGKVRVIFKGAVKWHDEEVRTILLSKIEGNPSTPKNSYKSSSLNKIVSPKKPTEEKVEPKVTDNTNEKNEEIKNEDNKAKE